MINYDGVELYNYIEAGEIIGVSPITLRSMASLGKIKLVRIGSSAWLAKAEIERYKNEHKKGG